MFRKPIIKLTHSKLEDLYFIDNTHGNIVSFTSKIEDAYIFLDHERTKTFIDDYLDPLFYKDYKVIVNDDIVDKYNITLINKVDGYIVDECRYFEINRCINKDKYNSIKKILSDSKNIIDKMIYYIKDNNNNSMIYNFLLENSDLYSKNLKIFETYNIYIKEMDKDFNDGEIVYLELVDYETEIRNKKLLKLNKNNIN